MQDGSVFAHPISERRITETGGSVWPSPNTMPMRPQEGSVRMLRAKVLSQEMTEVEASAMLNGKSVFSAQGKIPMWPTPSVRGFTNDGSMMALAHMANGREEFAGMAYRAGKKKKEKMWPTPTAHNAKETNAPSEAASVGGTLNPAWVAWLMAFPLEYINSKDWVTRKSQPKQQQHGGS